MRGIPRTKRSLLMRRAWAIFRTTYNFPAIPFRSIGRPCFAWALRKAWTEERAADALGAELAEKLEARAAIIRREMDDLKYRGWNTNLVRERDRLDAALLPITAELTRRAAVHLTA
jgi:hypothetical protein